jgi:hypothetical protein
VKARTIKKKIEKNSPEIKQLYLDEIKKHVEKAQELSNNSIVPTNHYKQFLHDMPSYIINKMLGEISITI